MSSIYKGTTEFTKVYLGANEISNIYNGIIHIFQSYVPVPGTPIVYNDCYLGTSIFGEKVTVFNNIKIGTAIKNN